MAKNDGMENGAGGKARGFPWGLLAMVGIFVVVLLLVITFGGALMGDPRGETIPPGP